MLQLRFRHLIFEIGAKINSVMRAKDQNTTNLQTR